MAALLVTVIRLAGVPISLPPHRLAGQTLLDGSAARRRIMIYDRTSGVYVVSTFSDPLDGRFALSLLPAQSLSSPWLVLCMDDKDGGNAQVFDWVYQVDDDGNPPTS